jgi:hypothetical protein
VRKIACFAFVLAMTVPAEAQFRNQSPGRVQTPAPRSGILQPMQVQQPGNYQVQGNLIFNRTPTWVGNNTVNGQLIQPMPVNPYLTNPLLNPYNAPVNPFTPVVNPYAPSLVNPNFYPQYPISNYNSLTAQQLLLMQQNPFVPYNPLQVNNPLNPFAPVVGVGGGGFAAGR